MRTGAEGQAEIRDLEALVVPDLPDVEARCW